MYGQIIGNTQQGENTSLLTTLTEEEKQWLLAHPVIRVVQDPAWPPIEFTDDTGVPSGMSADYLALLESQLGIQFDRIQGLSWQQAFEKLKNWEIDMTTSVAVTDSRSTFWAFTEPYMQIPIVIISKKDVAYVAGLQELSGKKVAVVAGYAAVDWISKDFPEIELVEVSDVEAGLKAVQRGNVFAFIDNMLVIGHYLTEMNMSTTLKIVGDTPYNSVQCMAVRKDWAVLAGILNKGLDSISYEQKAEIYRKWVPVRYEQGFDYARFWRVFILFVVILLLLSLWILALLREVSQRKRAQAISQENAVRFQQLFQISPIPLLLTNSKCQILEANHQWLQTLGYQKEEVGMKEPWHMLINTNPAYSQTTENQRMHEKLSGQDTLEKRMYQKEYQVTCKHGDVRSMEITETTLGNECLLVFIDITERKRDEMEHDRLLEEAQQSRRALLSALEDQQMIQNSLSSSNATLQAALDNMTDAVSISDMLGNLIHINHAFVTYHHFSNKQECLKNFKAFPMLFDVCFPDGTPAPHDQWAVSRALKGENKSNEEYILKRKDTNKSWVGSYSFSPIYDQKGVMFGSVVVCRDITDSKHASERLRYQRNHDYLTGLFSRRYLENALSQLDTSHHLPLTLVMADTNGLKLINDSFGHETGDEVLRKTGGILRMFSREQDIVARYGGDEFVMLLPNTNSEETEGIIKEIDAKAKEIEIASIQLSLSFGFYTKTTLQENFISMFQKAEDMMYRNKLYENASVKNKTIGLVINSLFAKSDRESQHSRRVSALCEFLAMKMGLSALEISRMRIAGLMHDIGKIGIPENILNKPGKLTDAEWVEMKRHPETGYRILATSSEFSDISLAILEHHERWDGKGYPQGLSEENISIQARIIMIADAFDAMTSERSYKAPLQPSEALAEIQRCSGSHFDPDMVLVFLQTIHEFTAHTS
jgi:diguanylate cyclase (GGDEF)-like protein/PAS domain S-box-containing protein